MEDSISDTIQTVRIYGDVFRINERISNLLKLGQPRPSEIFGSIYGRLLGRYIDIFGYRRGV